MSKPIELENTLHNAILLDFYGQLLTVKAQEIMEMYYCDNLTLAEISIECGISRQGVHDTIRRSLAALEDYEAKLGLASRFARQNECLRKVLCDLDENRLELAKEALVQLREIL